MLYGERQGVSCSSCERSLRRRDTEGNIFGDINSRIYARVSSNAFRPHGFAEGPRMGELELTLSETKEPEDFNLHALFFSTRGQLVKVVYSNQSPGGDLCSPAFGNRG